MSALTAIGAVVLDALPGEPRRGHPLVAFGSVARRLEGVLVDRLRIVRNPLAARVAGLAAVLALIAPPTALASLMALAPGGAVIDALCLYLALGARSLPSMPGTACMRGARALALLLLFAPRAWGEIAVVDDLGERIVLPAPARRIVSLAPHATELAFAAGAGARVVGAVEYSDYPPAAKAIPRVGGYSALDFEAIVALRPDLVIGWTSGNTPASLERIRDLGFKVFASQPNKLSDIPSVIDRLAQLAGTANDGHRAAADFRARLGALQSRYARRDGVTVFYEIWNRPMMTVNDTHLISDVMRTCGGRNVFGELRALAPTVSEEEVIRRDPEVIVASGMGEARPEWLDKWRRWSKLTAVQRGNLYFIPPDLIQRPTPRVLDGAERMCAALDEARKKR